jgi:hypothetical protein
MPKFRKNACNFQKVGASEIYYDCHLRIIGPRSPSVTDAVALRTSMRKEVTMAARQMNRNNVGPMKIIAFEEHFKLPAIHQANKTVNDPVELAYNTISKSGHFVDDPKTGFPASIYDLGEGRIAAMDDAGIDVQNLSHTVPSTESLEPSLAKELSRQANDAMAAAISKVSGPVPRICHAADARPGGCSPRA